MRIKLEDYRGECDRYYKIKNEDYSIWDNEIKDYNIWDNEIKDYNIWNNEIKDKDYNILNNKIKNVIIIKI